LRGTLIDSIRNEFVEFATIAIIPKGSETPAKYVLSDSKGKFEIAAPTAGEYTLKIEFMGYRPVERSIAVGSQRVVEMGNISMLEQINTLESAVVSALGNPVIVKKDTIEYNASSFKTTDTDMLEELLKKLPGVEIDSDGKITANGKSINKIMIDGKAFFLNDPSIATKNLPANIIDKVRVVERKSDQSRFTGIDDGNEETVIDLAIRPGMMNGWFGNATGGYGSNERYQTAGMVSNFKEGSQLSVILNGNNTNNRAFTDIAGDMMRGMRGGGSSFGGGRIRVGGSTINLGGSGITTSWMAGVNANKEFYDGKLKVGSNYFYGNTNTVSEGSRVRQNFLPDSTFFNRDYTLSENISDNHRVALEIEWAPSERTSFIFRPNVSLGKGSFNDTREFSTDGLNGAKINDGFSTTKGDNNSQSTEGELLYRQRLGKPGRTFSINFNYSYSNNEIDGLNESETNIYTNNPSVDIVKQQYDQINLAYSLGARASYTEPLGKNFYMELAYRYTYRINNSEKNAYNFNGFTDKFDIRDEDYSNNFENKFINQQAEVNLRKNEEKYNYTIGFNAQPSYTESIGGERDIKRSIVNYSPSASYEYKFNEMSNIRIRYRGNTNQPSINQLQPVLDNSNPLFIPVGNPDLLPEFNSRLSLEYGNTKRETFRSVRLWLEGNYTMDKIVNMTWYENGGIQKSMPVNENGVWSISNNLMYNTPIKKSKFSISTNTRVGLNKGINYSNALRNKTTSLSLSEMLRLTYRGEKLELGAGGRASYSYAWYTIESNMKPATWTNSVSANINWTLPAGFNFVSDYNYTFYIGFGDGNNQPTHVWNAEASKQMLKKMATLKFKVFDILNQSRNMFRNTTDNYIEDIQNNTLQQYFMVSFTIRFGSFGNNNSGGRDGHRGFPSGGGFPGGGGFGGRRF
ncbi:MAG: TonB-dependent receptor, partial [Bacteroidales bacterium]|nr:TonB-dependent receptor [Bacteroidales bacterium]